MRTKMLILLIMTAFMAGLYLPATVFAEEKQKNTGATAVPAQKPAQKATTEGGPDLFYPETNFDFGDVDQSTTVTHIFKVLNKGDAPLKLTKVRAS